MNEEIDEIIEIFYRLKNLSYAFVIYFLIALTFDLARHNTSFVVSFSFLSLLYCSLKSKNEQDLAVNAHDARPALQLINLNASEMKLQKIVAKKCFLRS